MPRHLISDAHEWINEIPTVPIYWRVVTDWGSFTHRTEELATRCVASSFALSEGTGDPASLSGSDRCRGTGVVVSHLRSDRSGCTDDLVDP